jgi:hypothetical protein
MENNQERQCYLFICPNYPHCSRAKGRGCTLERDKEQEKLWILEEECNEENGYPFFVEDIRTKRYCKPD